MPQGSPYLFENLVEAAQTHWEQQARFALTGDIGDVKARFEDTVLGILAVDKGEMSHRQFENLVSQGTGFGGSEKFMAYEAVGIRAREQGKEAIGEWEAKAVIQNYRAQGREGPEIG
mgnify:CR=1 FL=1